LRRLTAAEVLAFLADGSRTGKLAAASPSAEPNVAPIWFVVDGSDTVFTTGERSVKWRNPCRPTRPADEPPGGPHG
jgi:hypothetical protein